MARGFLSGALLGAVVSIGAGGVASVVAPLPKPPEPPQISDAAPGETQAPQLAVSTARDDGDTKVDVAPQAGQSGAQVEATDQDTLTALDDATVASTRAPVTADVETLTVPADLPQTGAIALSQEDPVFPNPQSLAPMMPQDADVVSINTEPAARPTPKVVEPQVDMVLDEGTEGEAAMDAPQTEDTAAQTQAIADEVAVTDPAVDQVPEPEQQAELAPLDAPVVAAPEPEAVDPQTPIAESEKDDDAPQIAILAPSARPRIGTPAISLTDRNNGVTVNRPANETGTAEAIPVTIITDDGAVGGNLRPIERYAQKFSNPENMPLLGVVLIDDGSGPTSGSAGIAALRSFPYTLNFAVDSSLPDAAERMALYRGEGFEVLAMVDLPEGAQATDVETNLGVTLAQMREVVGVLEGTGTGLQGSRTVSDQVTAILQQTGHGLVTQDKGLNTMPKLARKEGVPAYPVFRDFDSKGQSATVIRRFLDQAAFKANQEGAVIMLGRLRPDTISALLLWGLQDRAGQVAIAPISAVLTRDDE